MTEPGQPWLTTSGSAFAWRERTWMKWMSSPSISVMNCGSMFSLASHLRQSYSRAQYCASSRMVASGTPCDSSDTVSFSGHWVAAMRRRRSSSLACGTFTLNGRMAAPGAAGRGCGWPAEANANGLADRTAAEAAMKPRRVSGVGKVLVGGFSGFMGMSSSRCRVARWRACDAGSARDARRHETMRQGAGRLHDGVADTLVHAPITVGPPLALCHARARRRRSTGTCARP